MARRIFHSGKKEWQYRESAQKYWNMQQSKQAYEVRITRRLEKDKKYGNVSEILAKEIVKRPNIVISYTSLQPIVKELIETSKYLSTRFSEKDIEPITIRVVRKCHTLLSSKLSKDKNGEERNE